MRLPARRTLITAALALSFLAGTGAAQDSNPYRQDDPRFGPDPRDTPDPRTARDPREVEQDPHLLPEGRDLFDYLALQSDEGRLRQAMVDNPWIVLQHIEDVCAQRLALTESGPPDTEAGRALALEIEERARHLADLADGGLRDTRYAALVSNRLAWDAEQLALFREWQQLFGHATAIVGEARAPADLDEAMTPLRQGLEQARLLNDPPSSTRTMALIGQIQAANGRFREAEMTMREVVRVGRTIRDFDSVWDALSVVYETSVQAERYEEARDVLRDQYIIAQDTGDADAADRVLRQLVELESFIRRG
jgi:tetratricopeptide (TPR) repeat protein